MASSSPAYPSASPITGAPPRVAPDSKLRVALLGNPNTGKTTLFNRLCGLRAKTANFPGTTTDARVGRWVPHPETPVEVLDLPGLYRLNLDLPESSVCRQAMSGMGLQRPPDAVVVVVDTTNLSRNLHLVAELLSYRRPTVVALNMVDLAQRRGLSVDSRRLARELGCPVVPLVARTGAGVLELGEVVHRLVTEATAQPATSTHGEEQRPTLPDCEDSQALAAWADEVVAASVGGTDAVGGDDDTVTKRLDQAFTHPLVGLLVFLGVMSGMFWILFELATVPMDLIEATFEHLGGWIEGALPAGPVRELLVDGVVAGVAGTVVFLPQICLLFFLISLLEDTGYLARAAFVMDRLLCRFGLPGQAFVPLLSSHACALPGIMATKLIPDRKDRLATILVAPFMSCSARLPVYVLLTTLLFRDRPMFAGLAFAGCYLLGATAALLSAFLARRTVLEGRSRPMVLELPSYKLPSLRSALFTALDQGVGFLRKAGTFILGICIVMWWLSAYPQSPAPESAVQLRSQAEELLVQAPEPPPPAIQAQAQELLDQAEFEQAQFSQRNSFAGRLGRTFQPVLAPLGYDWQLTVGVLTSFLAREVFVSTMAVLLVGDGDMDVEDSGVIERIRTARRDDGSPLFTPATSASLLVFFVLAMQCLPTLAVTHRETGSWQWTSVQLIYMSGLAYVCAFLTYHGLRLFGLS